MKIVSSVKEVQEARNAIERAFEEALSTFDEGNVQKFAQEVAQLAAVLREEAAAMEQVAKCIKAVS